MPFSSSPLLQVQDLGHVDYASTNQRMLRLVEKRAGGEIEHDQLLVCEFDPVLTVGRGGDEDNYRHLNLPVFAVSRGGKATFHGPGQLVVYPILKLEAKARDLHAYLHSLEEALIKTVGHFGLQGARDPRNTGCWVYGKKIAAIGIAVRRWVTYHGLALNVTTDLFHFRQFDPCGLDANIMTSFVEQMSNPPTLQDVKAVLLDSLHDVLRN